MNIKNIQYNKQNTIDCEIDHPDHGWIPFTASPNDSEEHGRTIYQEAVDGKLGEIAPYAPPVKTIDQLRSEKTNEIKIQFNVESNKPVSLLNIDWVGGFESASKLDSAIRLAETMGLTEVEFFDSKKVGHVLSLVDAKEVVKAIAIKYQTDFKKKQTILTEIETATEEQLATIVW